MYTTEQRRAALEALVRNGYDFEATRREVGYPDVTTLRRWLRDFEERGEVARPCSSRSSGRYTEEQRRAAVDHYLSSGRKAVKTARELGYPDRKTLMRWVDELAPGKRRRVSAGDSATTAERLAAAVAFDGRQGSAEAAAAELGYCVSTLYSWHSEFLGRKGGGTLRDPEKAARDAEALRAEVAELERRLRALRLEVAVMEGTREILKKGPGTDPKRLGNAEKALLVNSLRRDGWRLREALSAVSMAKSSYEYAAKALLRGPAGGRGARDRELDREAVVAAYEAGRGAYGYRRVAAAIDAAGGRHVGEWTVRSIMAEEGLRGRAVRRRRRYSSYAGEVSEAPPNLLRAGDGSHDFRAGAPNAKWVTDVTEFKIPAGKVYLSPVVDCFDGMPLGWSISRSPDAEMANSSLERACEWLRDGDAPVVHSDRGGHYRWPGWIAICGERGLVRSMSRKGCSPDNARAEGFFGRLKTEFFIGRDWEGTGLDEFAARLDDYLRWYRDERLKSDLGYRSPMQYRRDLGLLTAK